MSHAVLSPSSAHRWLVCTPSARLEESFEDRAGESAQEGTLAHAMAELKLRHLIKNGAKSIYAKNLKKLQKDPLYKKEMDCYTDEYIGFIREILLQSPNKPYVQAELSLDLSRYVPEGFGTADCIILYGDQLHIVDLKYGRSVTVLPDNNPQLRLYALGVLDEYAAFYHINTVHMHIFQPRGKGGGSVTVAVEALRAWGESIRDAVTAAYAGIGEQVPGEHCKFCKAKPLCRKYADMCKEAAKMDFKLPPLLTHAEVGSILKQAKEVAAWATKLEDWALSEALTGAEIPGWKAVAGRSSRQWRDFDAAFQKLMEGGIEESILYVRSPLTLAQIESEIGKKEFNALVGDMVIKKEGKPTLVEEDDKREAITKASAKEDFRDE